MRVRWHQARLRREGKRLGELKPEIPQPVEFGYLPRARMARGGWEARTASGEVGAAGLTRARAE